MALDTTWLALAIGNSRLHWARFEGNHLEQIWHTPHLAKADSLVLPDQDTQKPPALWIASVVPAQSDRWRNYPNAHFLTLADVPLQELYPTFGIDRALAVWGAIARVGAPVLVIDAGTALTFTGVTADHRLAGGAILPGINLQFQALGQKTANLPDLSRLLSFSSLPARWANDTEAAIASGVLYTLLASLEAFIKDWWQQFPGSAVVLTGGDGDRLQVCLQKYAPVLGDRVQLIPDLIFQGILAVRKER
jgi:type III pantothenate kinase